MNFTNMTNDEIRTIRRRHFRHSMILDTAATMFCHNRGIDRQDPLIETLQGLVKENDDLVRRAAEELTNRNVAI